MIYRNARIKTANGILLFERNPDNAGRKLTMEIRHIHYFIAVAENLSFTKAAQQLMIAQPPLSRQIKDLEDELGAVLFDRSPHGLHITPEGEAFLEYALRIMDLVKKSREHIAEMSKGLQGTISLPWKGTLRDFWQNGSQTIRRNIRM